MEKGTVATPEEVCRAVATDLRNQGITHEEVGKSIGKTRSIVSNVLSSKKRFSKAMASLFNRAYGYNINYLLYGEGPMKGDQVIHDLVQVPSAGYSGSDRDNILILSSLLDCAEGILRVINDPDALSAWDALTHGDFMEYTAAMSRLSENHGGRRATPILAKFVCDHVAGIMFVPVTSDIK